MKPLDVKTKFYNAESDEVFLEAQVAPKRFRCSIRWLGCILKFSRLHIVDTWIVHHHHSKLSNDAGAEYNTGNNYFG